MRAAATFAAMCTALIAAAPASAGDPRTETTHVVTAGETMSGIAARAGVPAAVIGEANGLRQPYTVRKGQRLVIPRQRSHVVKDGETGMGIANRYGVPYASLAIANGLDARGTVQPGQTLIVPAVSARPVPLAAPAAAAPATPYFRRPHDGAVLRGFAVRGGERTGDGTGGGAGHDGIDYAAQPLDMVRAAASGTVSGISRHDPRLGRKVTIDHGNGWKTAYGHLDRITVSMGDVVKQGERIGLAGRSGEAARTTVHFAILKAGRPVNPAPLLAR